jgi:hypothetical protein
MSFTPSYTTTSAQSAGSINRQLVADYGVLHREVYPQYIEKYGNQNFVLDLELMGKKKETPNRDFYHHRAKGRLHQAIGVKTAVVAANGAAAVITLPVSFHTSAGKKSPLRKGEVLEINASGIQGQIVSVSTAVDAAHTFTVVPLDDTTNFSVGVTDELLLRGNFIAGEASDAMDGFDSAIEQVYGSTTEIREDLSITDRALMEELEIEVAGGKGYKYLACDQLNRKFHNQEDWALVFGQKVSNTALNSTSVGSKALLKTIDKGGQKISYAQAGGFTLDVFSDIALATDIAGGASEYLWLCDTNQRIAIDKGIANSPIFMNGAVNYGSFNGDKELAIKMGYKSLDINGQSFHFKKYDALNSTSVYGVKPGYYSNTGWLIPMDNGVDAKTQAPIASLSVRTQSVDGSDVLMAENGLLSKNKNGKKAVLELTMLAYKGLEVFNEHRFMKVYGS